MYKRFNRRDMNRLLGHEALASDVVSSHAFGQAARRNLSAPTRRAGRPGVPVVKGYRHSMVGSVAQYRTKVPAQPAKPQENPISTPSEGVIGNRPKSGASDEAKTGVDRRAFVEPPKRNFNPFG